MFGFYPFPPLLPSYQGRSRREGTSSLPRFLLPRAGTLTCQELETLEQRLETNCLAAARALWRADVRARVSHVGASRCELDLGSAAVHRSGLLCRQWFGTPDKIPSQCVSHTIRP